VLPPVPYQDVRLEQFDGTKLLGQWSLIRVDNRQTVRGGGDCEHRCGRELGWDGMVNTCELLINAVRTNKPKMLTGLSQKACGLVEEFPFLFSQTLRPPANRQDLPHPVVQTWNVVSPSSSHRVGGPQGTADGMAGTGGWRKRTPPGNRADRGCGPSRSIAPRAQARRLPSGLSSRESVANRHRRESRWRW